MGQPINPKMCEQQIDGGVSQGMGASIYEEVKLDNGTVVNPSFMDYKIPTVMESPVGKNLVNMIAAAPEPEGPFGAKGFAEGTYVPFLAAVGNAFYNATGARITDLALEREKVLRALSKANKG